MFWRCELMPVPVKRVEDCGLSGLMRRVLITLGHDTCFHHLTCQLSLTQRPQLVAMRPIHHAHVPPLVFGGLSDEAYNITTPF